MAAAPIPPDESRRLAILDEYAVLDTPPEEAFDDITFLASAICETPIALISLIDDNRQWFKSRLGLGTPHTHRDYSFCAYAILEPDQLMVVPDATADARFASNPFVVSEPSIRFYAGAPLVTSEGDALGTLCVLDHKPRRLSNEQKRALRALSKQVLAQLELRRHVAALERRASAGERYKRALEQHRRRLEETVRETTELSLTDDLTGIGNRRALEAQLRAACAGLEAGDGVLSVAMIDVDRFKDVNDAAGHLAGDEVLTHIAAVLDVEARDGDSVGRFGGDEFLVILPGADAAGANLVAERMRRAVEHAGGPAASVTLSVGLATVHRPVDIHTLIDLADRALYQAKAGGRNQVATAIDIAEQEMADRAG